MEHPRRQCLWAGRGNSAEGASESLIVPEELLPFSLTSAWDLDMLRMPNSVSSVFRTALGLLCEPTVAFAQALCLQQDSKPSRSSECYMKEEEKKKHFTPKSQKLSSSSSNLPFLIQIFQKLLKAFVICHRNLQTSCCVF